MNIGFAREAAADWVKRHGSRLAGYMGAYFSGSTIGRPDHESLPIGSDVDVVVVLNGDSAPPKLGKFIYRDALIEVTFLSYEQLESADRVLSSYHLAGSFCVYTLIDDPTRHLSRLYEQVSRHFAEEHWVKRRCKEAMDRISNGLAALNASSPLHELVMSWLFPTGIMAHVLLAASLRNPTVRLRYLAARRVLEDYGREEVYPELLDFLGSKNWTTEQAQQHLRGLEQTFDAAAEAARTPFFFSSDITREARSIAIDGTRERIETGDFREIAFWITATFARCHYILSCDAPSQAAALKPLFLDLLADLGMKAKQDFLDRGAAALAYLPALERVAGDIMRKNPEIRHENQ